VSESELLTLLYTAALALLDQAQPPHVLVEVLLNYTIVSFMSRALSPVNGPPARLMRTSPTVITGAAVPHHHRELRWLC
jgi:hypothetical protein